MKWRTYGTQRESCPRGDYTGLTVDNAFELWCLRVRTLDETPMLNGQIQNKMPGKLGI